LVTLSKIYTKTGDKGETALGDGSRVLKDSERVSAYGDVDELNASIGVVINYATDGIKKILLQIQNDLFDLGADLCVPDSQNNAGKLRISTNQVKKLEDSIDQMNKKLMPLKSFILPGGSKTASFLHVSRTICRRAERSVVSLKKSENINENALKYLNRLSDFLFVASRLDNQEQSSEILWKPGENL
jgi:cob(I)alamin adenosyltransferase